MLRDWDQKDKAACWKAARERKAEAMGVDPSTIDDFDLKKDERDAQAQLLLE